MRPTLARISKVVGIGESTIRESLEILNSHFKQVGIHPTDQQILMVYIRERIQENIERDKKRRSPGAHKRRVIRNLSEDMSDGVIFSTLKLGRYLEEPFPYLRPTSQERRGYQNNSSVAALHQPPGSLRSFGAKI